MTSLAIGAALLAVAGAAHGKPGSAGRDDTRRQPEAAQLLRELIAIDSSNPPADTNPIALRLKKMFDDLGVPSEIIVAPNGKAAHFIVRIKGDGSKKPILLASHTDVVPAEASRWKEPPFSAVVKDGYIWGRGAIDNKGSVAAYAVAVARLVRNKIPLARDVIFLAEADEEQGTYHTGWLAKDHWPAMDAEFALNEGGLVSWGPDHRVNSVEISYVDKLTINLRMTATGPTGHSARPWPVEQTANGQLIRAMDNLTRFSEPVTLSPAMREYFAGLAKLRPGAFAAAVGELLAANDDAGRKAAAAKLVALDPDNTLGLAGLLRNTLAITLIQSGVKRNVIPGTATATMNARLFPGSSLDQFMADLRKAIDNPAIKLEIISDMPQEEALAYYRGRSAVPPSSLDTELYAALVKEAKRAWPHAIILPSTLTGTTDATPWREHGIPVYGIAPNPTLPEQQSGVHGDDERIAVDALGQGTDYVYRVLVDVAGKH